MLLSLLILSVRIFVNDQNVDEVIKKSYEIPVFCVFYSPNCPPCRMMHPFWLQFMDKYAFDPNIIVAECESYTNHYAARKMLYFTTFPTYGLIVKGEGIILQVERTFDGFKSKAEEIKRINMNAQCQYFNYSDSISNNYPAIVLESDEGEIIDCSFLSQLSKSSRIPLNHFYLSPPQEILNQWIFPIQKRKAIKIYYSIKKSQKYNRKRKIRQIANFVRDQIKNPPLYDWNLNFPHKTQRQNVIIVYSDLHSIENLHDLIYEKSDKFSFSKIHFSSFNKSFHYLSLNDLPAMVFPDLKNSTCSILKNVDSMMNLRVSFDNNRFGKSNYPFSCYYYKYAPIGIIIFGLMILIVIILVIKNSKPEKTE